MPEKPDRQRPVLLAGLLIAALSGLPGLNLINCCCCAGVILGGVMAAYLYQQQFTPEMPPLETSDALIVGLLAGLVGAVGSTILSTLFALAIGPLEAKLVNEFYGKLLDRLVESGSIPDNMVEQLKEQMEESMHRAVTFGGILSSFLFNLILYPLFSMLGGLLGYAIFRKKIPPVAAP